MRPTAMEAGRRCLLHHLSPKRSSLRTLMSLYYLPHSLTDAFRSVMGATGSGKSTVCLTNP